MKTFSTIFGGKLTRYIILGIALSLYINISAQPCANPPVLSLAGDMTMCEGQTATVNFNITAGTPPWRFIYSINGVPQPEITNVTSSPYILNTGTPGTYAGVSIVDINGCVGTISGPPLTITQVLLPVVEAGQTMNSCHNNGIPVNGFAENFSSIQWTATGNGVFLDPNSLSTIYFPGTNNISSGQARITLTVYALPPCTGSVSDDFMVYIYPGPEVSAGSDATSCGTMPYYVPGATALNYSSISWTTSGTGTFLNPGSLNPLYNPSPADVSAGSVTLTITVYGQAECSSYSVSDHLTLWLTPEPTANAGAPAIICEGSSLTINDATASNYNTLAWTTSGTGTFTNGNTLTPIYTPSANDILSGNVILTLTATPLAPCSQSASSSKNISFSLIPTVYAGSDGTVCDNTPFNIIDAQVTDYTSVNWTTSGSGTFTNPGAINTTYQPSMSDVSSGSVTLTLTAYGDAGCNLSESDFLILTLVSSPVISAGVNETACENSPITISTAAASNYSSIQWTSNGTGSLSNAATLTPTYIPSHNDALTGTVTLTLSVVGNGPCTSTTTDAMQITVIPLPAVNAGNDLSVCSTNPISITSATAQNYSSVIWNTSGTGVFSNPNSLNTTYTPSIGDVSMGFVTLTLTGLPLAPCVNPASDNLRLNITAPPTANAGPDDISCDGTYLVTAATATNYSTVNWTTSGTGVLLNPNTLTPTYTASAQDFINGSVNLILTAQGQGPCAIQATDFMVITLPGLPVANAGTDAVICEATAFQINTATASNYGTINWSTSGSGTFSGQNTLSPIYNPSLPDIANGSVTLTMTVTAAAPCSNTSTDQMLLTILRNAVANAGPDVGICENGSAVINGTVANSSAFTWSTSGDGVLSNTSTLTPTYLPGPGDITTGSATITLTAYSNSPCTNSSNDNMIVYIGQEPVVNAGTDQLICEDFYTISNATASNYNTVYWSTSGTGSFINGNTVNATYLASSGDLNAGSVTLTLTATSTFPCLSVVSDQVVITFTPQPTAYAGPDGSTCGNDSYTLVDATAGNYSNINWTTSGTGTFSNSSDINPTYFPSAADFVAGYVTLTITTTGYNLCNLTASDQMILSFNNQPVVNAGPDISSCDSDPVQITGASAINYTSIYWTHDGSGLLQNATGLMPVYVPSQADILDGQVILTLHGIAIAPCTGTVTDEMAINIQAGPDVYAGGDVEICASQNVILDAATANNYLSIVWTTDGSGTFSNNTTLNPVYTPSASDIAAGSVILTLTATGPDPCNTVESDFLIVTITESVTADAGPDAIVCGTSYQFTQASASGYSSLLWTTSGTGSFTDPTVINTVYTPGQNDILAGSVTLTLTAAGSLPCGGQAIDNVVLTIPPVVIANAGNDGNTCGNTPFMVSTASASVGSTILWTTSGTGTFTGHTTLTPIYTPSIADIAAGSVILTMQVQGAAPCYTNAQDNMTLSIATQATAFAGPDAVICSGSDYTVVGASATNYSVISWTSSGSGSFTNGNSLSPTYTPSALDLLSGSVTLTMVAVSQGPCTGSASDAMLLSFASEAIVNAGPDGDACVGQGFTVIGATASGATLLNWSTSGSGIIINGNTISPTYYPSAADATAGSVTLTLTANSAAPCVGTSTDNMVITVNSIPVGNAVITGPQDLCAGTSGIQYSVVSPVPFASEYFWAVPSGATIVSGNNTMTITVDFAPGSMSGNVYVTPRNSCGDGPVTSYPVNVGSPQTPVVIASGPLNFCFGSSVILSAPSGFTYLWSTGETTQSITVTTSGSYFVIVTDASGCSSEPSDPIVVTVDGALPAPEITITGTPYICAGEPITIYGPTGYAAYQWSNGATTQNITVTSGGDYSLIVTDAAGCESYPSNIITIIELPSAVVSAGNDEAICTGSSFTINSATANGYTSVQWASSGTGTWMNANTLTPTYTPSLTDISNGSVVLTLTALNQQCDASDDMILTFLQNVMVSAGPDDAICNGLPYQVSGSSASNFNTLNWTSSGTGTFNDPTILYPVYTPSALDISNGVVQLSLSGTAASPCTGVASDVMSLTIRQTPVVNAGMDESVCAGNQYVINDATAANYTTLTWLTSGTGYFINGSSLTPTYVPGQFDIVTGSVVLTLVASNLPCAEVSDSKVLTISPIASVEAGPDATICPTCTHTVSGASVLNALSYIWTTTGTGTLTDQNTLTPSYVPSSGDISNGSVTLILTAESNNGCGSFSDQMTIFIDQSPPLNFTWNGECELQPTSFIVDANITPVGAIAIWNWSFGDGFYSNIMNPVHTFPANGDYTVNLTVTDTAGNTTSINQIVTISSNPQALFSIQTPNCSGIPTQFLNYSSTENGYITEWIWDFGDGSPLVTVNFPDDPNVTHLYGPNGTYQATLTVVNSYGCMNSFGMQISILPSPIANFYSSPACQGMIVDFQDASSSNGAGSIIEWSWNFGDPASGVNNTSNLINPQHTFSAPGSYQVTLIVTNFNGCNDTIVKQVNAGIAPPVAFTWQASCENALSSFFTDPSIVNINAIAYYLWDFGDGSQSNIQDPQHLYTAMGDYQVTLTITDTSGCINSVTNLISIAAGPTSYFTFSEPTCNLSEVQFTNQSTTSTGYVTQWEWSFGDGNSTIVVFPDDPNITHTYANAGSYNVTLTVTTSQGCEDSFSRLITVLPEPVANFGYNNTCLSEPVMFNDLSQNNGAGQITNWVWDFGDPASGANNSSTSQNPSHIYAQPGNYNVLLTITTANSCIDTVTKLIVINPAPLAEFSTISGCSSDTTWFVSSNFVSIPNTIAWFWDFGDGTSSTQIDPVHIYSAPGTYYVTLTITDISGCQASVMHPTNIISGPVAMFTYDAPACSDNEVQFNDLSNGLGSAIITWEWDFGDGTTQTVVFPANPDVTHIYTAPGTYTVTLSVTNQNGCGGTTLNNVNILPDPSADFTFEEGCEGNPVAFTDISASNGGAPIIQWYWNFNDPSSGSSNTSNLQNPLHVFSSAGSYSVMLVSTSAAGCQDTVIKQVNVYSPPLVAFNSSLGCAGEIVSFIPDPTVMNIPDVTTWLWDFGDGTGTSSQMSPSHIYATYGTYNVTLTVTNSTGCAGSITQPVPVSAPPVATFTAASTCMGSATSFQDLSYSPTGEPIMEWLWVFGDPASGNDTSIVQNPVHEYKSPGIYNVSLTVSSSSGCQSTVILPVEVVPAPVAAFSYITNACDNGTVSFRDQSASYLGGISSWDWQFEPYYYSNLQNPQHTFANTDTCYTVQLVVTDALGCIDTTVQQVCVPAGLQVEIQYTPTCQGEITHFSPVLVAPAGDELVSYLWNFDDIQSGNYNTSHLENPTHYFENIGNYLVSLTAVDINGCTTTVYSNVSIEALPRPSFTYISDDCDSTIYFTDMSMATGNGIVTWIWDYGDGNIDTINGVSENPAHLYATTGVFDVTLTVLTASGCDASYTATIEKMPCLQAEFEQIVNTVCERGKAYFRDFTQCGNPIDSWTWFFGDGDTMQYSAFHSYVTHQYQNDGTYQVSLVVSTTLQGITVYDTTTRSVTVVPAPDAEFATSNICIQSNTQFIDQTQWNVLGERKWLWDFGDQQSVTDTATRKNPSYLYNSPGEYPVTLIVTNEFGCSDTISRTVTAHRLPVANFEVGVACRENKTLFTDLSTGSDTTIKHWWWKFSDSVTTLGLAGVQDPYFIFEDTGEYSVDLVVVDANGCTDTTTQNFVVNPKPTADFTMTDNYENTQGRVLFTNTSSGGNAFEWDFDSAIPSFEMNPVVEFPGDGEYEVSLIAYNEFDCPDTLIRKYTLVYKGLWIPNAFSPNNPNSQVRGFKPVGINLKSFMLEVYDTWGNILWTTNKLDENGVPSEVWDGVYNGKLLPQDTYLWKATAVFKDGTIWDGKNVGNSDQIPEYTYGTVYLIR